MPRRSDVRRGKRKVEEEILRRRRFQTIVDDDLFCSNLAYLGQNETKIIFTSFHCCQVVYQRRKCFRNTKKSLLAKEDECKRAIVTE